MLARAFIGAVALATSTGCAPTIQKAPPPERARALLWEEPRGRDDLFFGVGGKALAPDPDTTYALLERDPSGFSTTLDLRDPEGREWGAKLGPESQTEVVASRILWAVGYQQPPAYYVPHLVVEEEGRVRNAGPARMRPEVEWLDDEDPWSWSENPFVGTQSFRGLRVLMAILNSTDLKDDNNEIFVSTRGEGPPVHWYVVKDLGATFGDTGRFSPARGDIEAFERHGFIADVRGREVAFEFGGRHGWIFEGLTLEDVAWICRRLQRLSDEQLSAAFRAGGYEAEVVSRYVARLREKTQEGLAAGASASAQRP